MRKLVFVLGIVLALTVPVKAQERGTGEIFGGFSYLNVDTNGLSTRQSAWGWEAAATGNLNKIFAIEADFSGFYKTYDFDFGDFFEQERIQVAVSDYSYTGGPRVNFGPVFAHALLGADDLIGSAYGQSLSQTSFATAFGGGIQQRVKGNLAVRFSADYVLTHHNLGFSGNYTQSNYRAAFGLVYTFGEHGSERASKDGTRTDASPSESVAVGEESAILGVTGYRTAQGFKVTAVHRGSKAEMAGMRVNDVIASIDGRPVMTAAEIRDAASASASGELKVSYLISGAWSVTAYVNLR